MSVAPGRDGPPLHLLAVESSGLAGGGENVKGKGTSDGVLVSDGLGAAGNDDTVSAAEADGLGELDLAVLDVGEGSDTTSGDEGDLLAGLELLRSDGDGLADLGGGGGDGSGGEGNDGERCVGLGAALDEGSSQRVGLVEGGGGVIWGTVSIRLLDRRLDPGRVAGLGGEDGAGSGEVVGVGNVLGSTEVGTDTDTLEELRGGDERLDASDAKVVGALSDSLVTESLGQEGDVGALVATDLNEAVMGGA